VIAAQTWARELGDWRRRNDNQSQRMSELCAVHKIVAAPDGRCVLCRRPKFSFGNDEENETVASKTFTALLGLGLLGAMGFAAYAFTVPNANASANSTTRTEAIESNTRLSTEAQARAEDTTAASTPSPAPEDQPAEALIAEAAAPQKPAAQAPPNGKRARARTIGKKIVDPRLIEARKSVKVTMYSAPWCFICDRARNFLEAREVELVDYDVDMNVEAEKRLQQLNPTGSIPTFIVDGKTIVGFHPWGLEDLIDEAAQQHFCMKNTQGAVCERLASAR
jgi:glutaredoxin